ncbi:MAG: DUF3524 domain-containing protein [Planctomycetes bacterium]|nr:DUF3524 domain-containing protein [Planctomycetota bacterium]
MTTFAPLNILALEPYMTGSHRSFLEGLKAHSRHRIEVRGLPGRKWKWRMRASAVTFAQELEGPGQPPDLFFASDFLDVAAFRSLLPERLHGVPVVTYFHENQLTYPVPDESERDYQFVFTNLTTCLASDRVLFNSQYHRENFLEALPVFLRRMPDHVPDGLPDRIRARSGVQHLGIEPPPFAVGTAADRAADSGGPRTIVWNHRWEYDKNPDLFFRTLFKLDETGPDFRLIVLGESFRESPPVFEEARERLRRHIEHFGYAADRSEYWRFLRQGDIVASTSIHEFFGLSVLEGITAGCFPLLPYRLSYPELLPITLHADCFYRSDEEFEARLSDLLSNPLPPQRVRLRGVAEGFQWGERIRGFDAEFEGVAAQAASRRGPGTRE